MTTTTYRTVYTDSLGNEAVSRDTFATPEQAEQDANDRLAAMAAATARGDRAYLGSTVCLRTIVTTHRDRVVGAIHDPSTPPPRTDTCALCYERFTPGDHGTELCPACAAEPLRAHTRPPGANAVD